MMEERLIEQLLRSPENEYIDFKKTIYRRPSYPNLLLDVMSMANSAYEGNRYIVMGVKQFRDGVTDVHGINEEEKEDSSTFQQLIFENIEPYISIELHYVNVDKKTIAVLELKNPKEQPYMMRKKFNNLHEGLCYVRRGSQQGHAMRQDFIRFATRKENFELSIVDGYLRALNDRQDFSSLKCRIRNLTSFPVMITDGYLEVLDSKKVLSKMMLYGFEEDVIGADFRMELRPMSEKYGDLHFSFGSSDVVRMRMDESGILNSGIRLRVVLIDSSENTYAAIHEEPFVSVRGEFLWKVR